MSSPNQCPLAPSTVPTRLTLKKDEKLEIVWSDGHVSVYPIDYLRAQCPCAMCREERAQQEQSKLKLRVLKSVHEGPITIADAQKVGNYAIRLVWTDGHDTGIYSFHYLRSICPAPKAQ